MIAHLTRLMAVLSILLGEPVVNAWVFMPVVVVLSGLQWRLGVCSAKGNVRFEYNQVWSSDLRKGMFGDVDELWVSGVESGGGAHGGEAEEEEDGFHDDESCVWWSVGREEETERHRAALLWSAKESGCSSGHMETNSSGRKWHQIRRGERHGALQRA